MKLSDIFYFWRGDQEYYASFKRFINFLIGSKEFQAALPTMKNVCHLELINRGTDFPLQTIFQPTKVGNYLISISGIDSATSNNINLTMVGEMLGGMVQGGSYTLYGPGDVPVLGVSGWTGQIVLDTTPVQMSIINSAGPGPYAGGQTYTVYVDIVYQGRSTPGC
jgi:hypothetical protein